MRAACLLWIVGIALGKQGGWERLTQEGDGLVQAGRYQDAEVFYQLAVHAEAMPVDLGVRATAWNILGMISVVLGSLVETRPQYQLSPKGFRDVRFYGLVLELETGMISVSSVR